MDNDSESKYEYWQRHLRRQKESGLSQRSYCDSEGLSLSKFYYWHRREREARSSQSNRLTEVPLRLRAARESAIEIEVAGGYLVRVDGEVNEQRLIGVIKALQSLR